MTVTVAKQRAMAGRLARLSVVTMRSRRLGSLLLSALGGLVIGALIIAITGHSPIDAYAALVDGAFGGPDFANLVSTINRALLIIGTGLAAAVAYRAGFFNVGMEGQMVLGALASSLAALYLPLPGFLMLPFALVVAAVVGGLYALIAAVLEFRLAVPILISTLILNYPARYLASYLAGHPFRDVATGMPETHMVPGAAQLPLLSQTSSLHAGLFIVIALLVIAAFVLRRTTFGYRVNITGLNPRFARYAGISIPRIGYSVMFASGAISGIVGAIEVLGVDYRFIDGALTDPGYAWTGLMAALLAGSTPFGVAAVGFFFAALEVGAFGMEQATSVPRELAEVLQAVIILLIVARVNFRAREREV